MTHFKHVLSHALKANGSTLSHGKVEVLKISPVQEAWEQLIGKDIPSDLQTTVERAAATGKLYILFFAGDIRPDDISYSHSVRQTIISIGLQNVSGYNINKPSGHRLPYEEVLRGMSLSIFCLALTGAGWGVRIQQSIMMGCIPVVIADDVEMPFEDVLPYKDFAIRIPQHAIYRLPQLLQSVMDEPDRVITMQQRLACAHLYLTWNKKHGRAIESLACSLKRRHPGYKNIFATMDWDHCNLSCGGEETLPFHTNFTLHDVDLRNLDEVDQRMQLLKSKDHQDLIIN